MDSTKRSPKEIKEAMLVNKLRSVLGRMELATMMSSDGLAWTDENGRMEWCNSAFEDSIGQERTELIGLPLADILILNDRDGKKIRKKDHPINVALSDSEHRSYQVELANTGERVTLDAASVPTGSSEAQKSAVVVIRRNEPLGGSNGSVKADVGEQLVALVDENARLADRVKVLEQDLEDAEQRAADTLDSGYHAKSAFLGNMTHELRTPLSAIMGYADLLRRDLLSQGHFNWAKDVAQIRHASDQLFFMITELLDLAAIEEDQNEVHVTTFKVEKLMADVSHVAREYMVEQHNTLNVDIHKDTPLDLTTDESKLRKILLHLLSNAAKFTVKGMVKLEVEPVELESEPAVLFRVSDTGIGMTSEQIKRIFDAFTQADESLTRSFEGGGIGLYICNRFSQLLGGDIHAESETGEGATFTVRIPISLPFDRL